MAKNIEMTMKQGHLQLFFTEHVGLNTFYLCKEAYKNLNPMVKQESVLSATTRHAQQLKAYNSS